MCCTLTSVCVCLVKLVLGELALIGKPLPAHYCVFTWDLRLYSLGVKGPCGCVCRARCLSVCSWVVGIQCLRMFRFAPVFGDGGLVGSGMYQEMCGLCVFAVSRGL